MNQETAMKITYPSCWCESISRIAIVKPRSGEYLTDRTRILIQDLENIWYMCWMLRIEKIGRVGGDRDNERDENW